MSTWSRYGWRLHQRMLRCYEIGLCATLLAAAVAMLAPAFASEPHEETVQCGNIQSSTVVMQR